MSDQVIYTVGGTVQAGGGIYISRDADEELLRLCRVGEFCYVLTARQIGKSSLMVATREHLAAEGIRSVEIDLTQMGTELSGLTAEQWYLGLIELIVDQLDLDVDYMPWWDERARLGPTQRLSQFLRQVVLEQVSELVVIFIDEIDSTLNLDFTDDFFAAIRACYNARASDPVFKRLSFVLLGVATPGDLISDPQRTPFNIGRRMDLTDFTERQAIPLAAGLGLPPGEAGQVLSWILDWTGGHPYLTQRLCAAAAASPTKSWDAAAVDKLVEKTFFGEQSAQDSNLQFVRDMLTQRAPDKAAVLKTYRRIHAGKAVPDEERSPVKTHLKLSGIVKAEDGYLHIRNEIYRRVFDLNWIKANTPVDWRLRVASGLATVAMLLLATLGGYTYYQSTIPTPTPGPPPIEIQAQTFAESFRNTDSADVRADSLAGLFKLGETDPKYEAQAHQLFATLTPDGKAATLVSLFKLGETDPKHERQTRQLFTTLTFDERVAILASLLKLGETDPESKELAYQFFTPLNPDEKMVTLANLFEPLGFEDRARAFFYKKLTSEEQLALFEKADPGAISTQLIIVVKGLYTELEDNGQDNQLLQAMAQPLRELDDPMAMNLATEIEQWLTGRKAYAAGKYQQAVDAYNVAISLNDRNPGTYFDRGLAYTALGEPSQALTDFETVLSLGEGWQVRVRQKVVSDVQLYAALRSEKGAYQALTALVFKPLGAVEVWDVDINPRNSKMIYAVVKGQGIYRSTDGGYRWEAAERTFETVESLAIDPTNPSVLYASIWDGILKSTDSGATWELIAVGKEALPEPAHVLAVVPGNGQIIYAGTEGGVYRSSNGGQKWEARNKGMADTPIYSLAIGSRDGKLIYAAGRSEDFWKSIDGGSSPWEKLSSGYFREAIYALALHPRNSQWIYAGTNDSTVVLSTNGGRNWQLRNWGLEYQPLSLRISSLAIDPRDPRIIYAGTGFRSNLNGHGVYKSTDGGLSWKPVNNGLPIDTAWLGGYYVQSIAIDPNDSQIIYAAGFGGLYKSTDGGQLWKRQ